MNKSILLLYPLCIILTGCSLLSSSEIMVGIEPLDNQQVSDQTNMELISEFEAELINDSLSIDFSKYDTIYGFKDIFMESSNKSINFTQFSLDTINNSIIQYQIFKPAKKKSHYTIEIDGELYEGESFQMFKCSNHTPPHSCSVLRLKECKKASQCEF